MPDPDVMRRSQISLTHRYRKHRLMGGVILPDYIKIRVQGTYIQRQRVLRPLRFCPKRRMAPTRAKKVNKLPHVSAKPKRTTRQTNTVSTDRTLGPDINTTGVINDESETPADSGLSHRRIENLDSAQDATELARENAAMRGQL